MPRSGTWYLAAYGKLVIEEGGELVGEIQAMHGAAAVPGGQAEAIPMRANSLAPGSLSIPARH